jgi:serine/threonine kinase PknH
VGPGGADKKAKSGNKGLLIGGGVAAAVIAVIAVVLVVVFTGKPDPAPPPPPPPSTVSAAGLTGLLLTPDEVNSVVGATKLEPGTVYEQLQTEEPTVSDTACTGSLFSAIKSVYQGSGYSAVVDQAQWSGESTDRDYTWISQTAVTFPSAEQADAFRGTSKDAWEGCDGKTLTVTQDADHNYNWTLGSVTEGDSQISQMQTQEGMSGYACQHVLRTVSNVVIETVACNDRITDEADRMAGLIADKATE